MSTNAPTASAVAFIMPAGCTAGSADHRTAAAVQAIQALVERGTTPAQAFRMLATYGARVAKCYGFARSTAGWAWDAVRAARVAESAGDPAAFASIATGGRSSDPGMIGKCDRAGGLGVALSALACAPEGADALTVLAGLRGAPAVRAAAVAKLPQAPAKVEEVATVEAAPSEKVEAEAKPAARSKKGGKGGAK